jgi:lysophospholipase
LTASFVSFSALALDEATVSTTFFTKAMPYFRQHLTRTMISEVDGTPIRFRIFEGNQAKPKGTILLVNGRTEFMAKYAEALYDLRDSGFQIVTYDHRGQGESGRLIGDPLKGYVEKYQHYLSDVSQIMRDVVLPLANGGDVYFLSHSMGGGIAEAWTIDNPGVIKKLVASSAMDQINTKAIPEWVAHALATVATGLNFGESYIFGANGDSWKGPEDPSKNVLTTSIDRYTYVKKLQTDNPAWIISGPTFQWTREALRLGRYVRGNANRIQIPVLVMEGTADEVVLPQAEEAVAKLLPCGQLLSFVGAKHEILIEKDVHRERALRELVEFLKKEHL